MALTKVDLKGLEDGTDGQIITYDANGNPVAIGPGTDGQVLTSTGAGSPPAFENAASGGLSDVVSDTTPQLGGDLDVQTHAIKTSTTNGDIALYPNGTGDVVIQAGSSSGSLLAKFEHGKWSGDSAGGELKITGTHDSTDIIIQGGNANKAYIKVNGDTDGGISLVPNGAGSAVLNTHQVIVGDVGLGTAKEIISTGAGTFSLKTESNADISITPDGTGDVTLDADTVRVGDSNADVAITTNGTGDLTLSTNAGTDSGTIEIEDGANNDIIITPNGSGDVIIDGLKYPQADGSADQVLKTNGSAQLSWTTPAAGAFTHSGDNIYAGTGAGAALAGGANYNFIAGNGAGADVSTGDHNVCVGNDAGHAVTTGSNNICIGQKTGYDLDDATGNIHIGYLAGEHTTGNDNVFIGHRAGDGDANTSYYNTCIGPYAGKAKPMTGYGNTFVGAESAAGTTDACSGLDNTGIGRATLNKIESGDYNFAGGINALYECTTGNSNIAIGLSAGYSITSGDNNIGIGQQALTSSSPSGNITTTDYTLCLGNNSISNFYCADTSISSSDKRDKTDIADFTHGLDWIKKLKPITYRWDKRSWYNEYNEDGSVKSSKTPDGSKKTQRQHIGFLAQDVLEVEKSFGYAGKKDDMLTVNLNEDDTAYGMKYERLVPILVNAIKELEAK